MKRLLIVFVLSWTATLYSQDWPREILSQEGTITIYQPQIESFQGNSLSARAAISILPKDQNEPVFGAVWLNCRVSTDRTNRTVKLEDVTVKQMRFPSGTDAETAKISASLEDQLPRLELTFSLDLLLESLETAQKERETARELEVAPPKIIVMNHPAVLVLIDGDPVLTDVPGTSLKRVTNTPYFLVQVPSSGQFYLRGGSLWYAARDVTGPWRKTDSPPQAVVNLSNQSIADNESDEDLKANDIRLKTGKVPEIVVSTEPAELIATDGAMQLSPIKGTGLLYVSNTPSRVFVEIGTQQYYVLISGRWYQAAALTGPWTNIESKKLPTDFAKIPPGSECDDVLSSVAGTVPAKEAMLDAQIPQTAEVDRATATTNVQYDGDPQFEPIENTGMEYAVNAPTAVIRFGGRYYVCDKAVWFEGPAAFGPWAVCVDVPEVIYRIPPRYPVYNVRYVRVYNYTPSVAYVGYTAGYTGCYVFGGTVVYGTGYAYRSWYRHSYFARPWTWGFGVHYDPWTGWSLGVSVGWGAPHGWIAYNTRTTSAGWWGPVGYRPVYRPYVGPTFHEGYHPTYHPIVMNNPAAPRTGGLNRGGGATRSGTLYDRWTVGVKRPYVADVKPPATMPSNPTPLPPVRRENSMPTVPSRPTPLPTVRSDNPPAAGRDTRTPRAEMGGNVRTTPVPSKRENNVYAAPDGNILRKTPQGWQQRDQKTWKDVGQAPPAKQEVARDQEVRQRAAERTSSFKTPPPAQPAPKAPASRNAGAQRSGAKDNKKR